MISVRARRSLPEKVSESVSESVGAVPGTVLCSEEVGSLSVQRRKKLQKAAEIYASRIAAGAGSAVAAETVHQKKGEKGGDIHITF